MSNEGVVLIVEDDAALRHSLASALQALGFKVGQVSNGEQALPELRQAGYELVLLDLNMPGMGGLVACQRIRALYPRLQVLVLTVRDQEEDKVLALDAGADDYVTKPFLMRELAARMRAAIRRSRTPAADAQSPLHMGSIRLEPDQHRVFRDEEEVHLTPKEFDLLHLLMQHAGKPLSHGRLLTAVWGQEYGNEREYLRTYMSQLRRKMEANPAEPKYLLTESYIGYRFALPESAD